MNYRVKNRFLDEYGFKDPVSSGVKKMKAKVEKSFTLEDGKYEGVIVDIEYIEKPYSYVKLVIKEKDTGTQIKADYPFRITEQTALGLLLKRFGCQLKDDEEIEIEDYIKKGQAVEFMTITDKTDRGTFTRVLLETVKKI